ncbi:MAG: hypothetical protein EPO40_00630 [Myxococcaceae bacterium]|nr:MAG: hypothetical protein EPO40_00630 [Myxococcaceae bacterium]
MATSRTKKTTTASATRMRAVAGALTHESAADRARLDGVLKRIEALRSDEAKNWDALWEAVPEVIDAEEGTNGIRALRTASMPFGGLRYGRPSRLGAAL